MHEKHEALQALQALRRLIDEEMFGLAAGDGDGGEKRPESCPRCGGRHVVKRGRDAAARAALPLAALGS